MDEEELIKKIKEMGYDCRIERSFFSNEIEYIDIIPTTTYDNSKRINQDLVYFLKEQGFEFDNLIIDSSINEGIDNTGTIAIFRNTKEDIEEDEDGGDDKDEWKLKVDWKWESKYFNANRKQYQQTFTSKPNN